MRTVGRFDGIGWAFTHNDLGQPADAGHFYRPVWVLWNVGIDRLSGGSAAAYHAGNLLLLAVATAEVWLLLRRLLGSGPAWIGAVAFALYPRHTESVAWISGNTDLVAAVFALGALLLVLGDGPIWLRTVGAGALAGLAVFSKEVAFVLPVLSALLALLAARSDRSAVRRALPPLVAILVVQAAVLVIRTVVLEGAGGYSAYPWSPRRVFGVLASDAIAVFSPPQLELLRHPVLLIVPAAVAALSALGVWRLYRRGPRDDLIAVGIGAACFLVALVPSLNLAVDLNNANGERLLFLPSFGLALAVAALARGSRAVVKPLVLVLVAALGLALPLHASFAWIEAGRIADRVIDQALPLGPDGGNLVVLSVPASYRNAHVFPDGLDVATKREGARFQTVVCLPLQVVEQRSAAVSFVALPDGSYRGQTTWDVPFDFPVLRGTASSISPECRYERADGKRWPPGLGLVRPGVSRPAPRRPFRILRRQGTPAVSRAAIAFRA